MPEVIESGLEPEFFITDIVRCERAADGAMRVFVACSRKGCLVMQFTVVGSVLDFSKMAQQVLDLAADKGALAAEALGTVAH